MTTSNNILSFDDVRSALDRALVAPKGIKIYQDSKGQLVNLVQRIHKLRSLDRVASKKIFEKTDPRYGTSAYDKLSVVRNPKSLEEGECLPKDLFVIVRIRDEGSLQVEEIK